jgi:hypothetical protein
MSSLRASEISDILAATGKAGMDDPAGQRFWTWRRIVLAVGYGLVFLAGVLIVLAADPTGLALMLAAFAGVLFLHRTWVGLVVWAYVAASGVVALVSGDDMGLYGLVGGLAFGAVALPWRPRARVVQPTPSYWQQSPFIAPPMHANGAPSLARVAAAVPSMEAGFATEQTEPAAVPVSAPAVALAPIASIPRSERPYPYYPGALFVAAIGKISITIPNKDLTADLMRRPVVGFVWLYLFAREVRKSGDRITRTALIDEVAYGVADARGRLRGYLRDLSHLPAPLGSLIKVEDELIGFDLQGHDTDVDELRKTAGYFAAHRGNAEDYQVQHAQELLPDLGSGDFLPGFEDMEKRVTKGRGIAGQVVAEVRTQLHKLQGDVAVAVATVLLDRGQAADAVAVLEPVMDRSEDRDDVAKALINALRDSGQHTRAAEIRRRLAAGQES